MAILADLVQVVIGVDTHKHTAAVVAAASGGVLATQTVATTPAGYQALLVLAGQHPGARVWAVEGTGGYGAGLARLLTERGEWWWSWTARDGRRAAMAPSPTRSTPPAPPARRWAARSWPSLAPVGSGPP